MEDKFQLVVPHRQPDVLQGLTNTFFLRIKVIIRISRCARNRIFYFKYLKQFRRLYDILSVFFSDFQPYCDGTPILKIY